MQSLSLNLSGDSKSWFDFWHHHPILSESSSGVSARNLQQILLDFEYLKKQLEKYPYDYQIWVLISEQDFNDDAVYIHTKNPNGDNFPLKLNSSTAYSTTSEELKEFFSDTSLIILEAMYDSSKYFYLFDSRVGISLSQ